MNFLGLAMIGDVEPAVLDGVEEQIGAAFPFPTRRLPPLLLPPSAWDGARGQYLAAAILEAVLAACPPGAEKLLALTDRDLYLPMLSFIFGQAQLGGLAALVSVARLRQEFHGLPAQPGLLLRRARKEALHELGHAFGLVHCPDTACVMSLATSLRHLDLKGEGFCDSCRILLDGKVRLGPADQLRSLT